jgi:hypothetical protein
MQRRDAWTYLAMAFLANSASICVRNNKDNNEDDCREHSTLANDKKQSVELEQIVHDDFSLDTIIS